MSFTTYADLGFLKTYYQASPSTSYLDWTDADETWTDVRRFLHTHTRLVINATVEEARTYPFLQDFLQSGRFDNVEFDPSAFDHIEEADHVRGHIGPHTLFLLEDTSEPAERLRERFALLFTNAENLLEVWPQIGQSRCWSVQAGNQPHQLTSWSDLERLAVPVNAVILCDRYLLREDPKHGKETLVALLRSLLPAKAEEMDVDVTVVTDFKKDGRMICKPGEVHADLMDALSKSHPHSKVNLSLVETRKSGHVDRRIITNYDFFKSGHTLAYFNDENTIKETTLDRTPLLNAASFKIAQDKLKQVKKWMSNPAEVASSPPEIVQTQAGERLKMISLKAGSMKNRLLN